MSAKERPQDEREALAALRVRQGKGARYDSAAAPASDLLLARRGAAYFARKLNELDNVALDGSSSLSGVGRRLIVARVGYEARSMARIAEAAREGRGEESLGDPEQEPDDEVLGACLPAHALRHLFEHSQAHLNVEWRDLTDAAWGRSVVSLTGRRVTPRQMVRERAVTLWLSAVALGNGGRLSDVPGEIQSTSISTNHQPS
ncbi:maleylpyruvate isomerase N-terminal domain-containing protein [Brucella anthropi]|uniref:maleylpyruvate isomerase N-terminal domain-containing protein n=1 Tax=Brucella anthropi TaxID=529 RepID=UPI00124DD90F|nr:maleylpyruvate isomerase N-terminal domain-containing protein [Brucella anthropi]KAB2726479.1 maleylpyruvate isomerase [Brucella anthropi]KAB2743641.1 maleylpyruvate isomerase [Brucella anthropi]KAB2804388.1 maleylpyruvate isomerase [Brucella anthropi]